MFHFLDCSLSSARHLTATPLKGLGVKCGLVYFGALDERIDVPFASQLLKENT